ncbi:cytochrome d ubiquinol oxidase subunit II [Varibaculum massiliense]|uniref:cytochrome d ubiquinol oxidase subunit II n=1 Tax=Varibaculum massiliense TaxID=1852372 RepID=UPI0008D9B2FB|nr:cytochrome d ubiquinol oxidase subunit II [Varibaculum massiliense]
MTILQVIWFILIAVLWTGYLVLEGFGVGAGMVMPMVAKTDRERSQVQKTFGPVWDGNEVWLLTAGGATFAAFPEWYATMFSGMYLALFLILFCLIIRICAIEWRTKVASAAWRGRWDSWQTIVAWLVPILFGVAFANLVQGMNIAITQYNTPGEAVAGAADLSKHVHNFTSQGAPAGSVFLSLLTPYTIAGGVMLALVFATQGLAFLALRTTGEVQNRAKNLLGKFAIADTVLVAVAALWGQFLYASQAMAWIPLIIAALAFVAAVLMALRGSEWGTLLAHSVGIAGAVAWIFTAMAPNAMKSSIKPEFSLTIWDASSSQSTLAIMLVIALVVVPIVLGYTYWSYTRMPLKITLEDLDENPGVPWDKIRQGASFLAES